MKFRAEFVDAAGLPRTCELEAAGRAEALEGLAPEARLTLRRLTCLGGTGQEPGDELEARSQVAHAVRELGRALEQGLPLGPALAEVARLSPPEIQRDLEHAQPRVAEGSSLAAALEGAPGSLGGEAFRALLAPGAAGSLPLPRLLDCVARLADRLQALRQRALGALGYPLALFVMGGVLLGLVVWLTAPAAAEVVSLAHSQGRAVPWELELLARSRGGPWGGLLAALTGALGWGLWVLAGDRFSLRRLAGSGPAGPAPDDVAAALTLSTLVPFVLAGRPLQEAWRLRGLSGPAAGEGQGPARLLLAAGVLAEPEAAGVEAAAAAGPEALAEELEELAELRLGRFERRAQRRSFLLEHALLLALGGGAALFGLALVRAQGVFV